MKTPRVHDFDPHAKTPELGSPLDNFPAIEKPQPKHGMSEILPEGVQSRETSEDNVRSVRPVRPVRRMKIRHPFDLYQDQVETLRHFALEERKRGEQGSMSAMVREAIDTYIAKKTREEKA